MIFNILYSCKSIAMKFSSLFSKHLCIFGLHGVIYIYIFFFITLFTLSFTELSLVGLTLDLVD